MNIRHTIPAEKPLTSLEEYQKFWKRQRQKVCQKLLHMGEKPASLDTQMNRAYVERNAFHFRDEQGLG